MKLIVEFELDDSFEAYIPDNEEKLRQLLRPGLDGVKASIIDVINDDDNIIIKPKQDD